MFRPAKKFAASNGKKAEEDGLLPTRPTIAGWQPCKITEGSIYGKRPREESSPRWLSRCILPHVWPSLRTARFLRLGEARIRSRPSRGPEKAAALSAYGNGTGLPFSRFGRQDLTRSLPCRGVGRCPASNHWLFSPTENTSPPGQSRLTSSAS